MKENGGTGGAGQPPLCATVSAGAISINTPPTRRRLIVGLRRFPFSAFRFGFDQSLTTLLKLSHYL
jgi:hypothetical protein